jgi:hypothetical protein
MYSTYLQDAAIGVLENPQERLGPLPFRLGCRPSTDRMQKSGHAIVDLQINANEHEVGDD